MRFNLPVIGFCLLTILALPVPGQAADAASFQPVKPKVYALVAAIGDQFNVVFETSGTATLIDKFSRGTLKVQDNLLNMLALQALEKVVSRMDPDSRRVHLTFGAPKMGRDDAATLAVIRAQLENLPERRDWDRILVATPAHRLFDHDGLTSTGNMRVRLEGFGMFAAPDTSGDGLFTSDPFFRWRHMDDAISPANEAVKSKTYVAPFSYIQIWTLDAKDFTVIDKQLRFDHQKLADPVSGSLDLMSSMSKEFMAAQMVAVIELSVREAVMNSELNRRRGVVDMGDIKSVRFDDDKK